MAFHLLKGLREYKDLELSAILLNPGRLADEINGLGVPVEVYDERKLSFIQLMSGIRQAINKQSPDIIHSHRYKENILAFLAFRAGKRSKLISTRHGLPESNGAGSSLKANLISRVNSFLLSRRFHCVVAVSREVKRLLVEEERCVKEKVELIHNGIEVSKNIRRTKSKDLFVIGSAGRFFPVKDYPLMVEIARVAASRAGQRGGLFSWHPFPFPQQIGVTKRKRRKGVSPRIWEPSVR